ncbi:MAG: hypothetical protein RL839_12250 [Gammaproteobacteria bacterium]
MTKPIDEEYKDFPESNSQCASMRSFVHYCDNLSGQEANSAPNGYLVMIERRTFVGKNYPCNEIEE